MLSCANTRILFLFLLVSVVDSFCTVGTQEHAADEYFLQCALTNEPKISITRNNNTNTNSSTGAWMPTTTSTEAATTSDGTTIHNHNMPEQELTVLGRRCPCAPMNASAAYCPVQYGVCSVSIRYDKDQQHWIDDATMTSVQCTTYHLPTNLVRAAWTGCYALYGFLGLALILTQPGRHAVHHLISSCRPKWRERQVDYIMAHDYGRMRRMLLRSYDRQRRALLVVMPVVGVEEETGDLEAQTRDLEQMAVPWFRRFLQQSSSSSSAADDVWSQPTQVALKTRIFRTTGDAAAECCICFAVVEDGERVGALPCQHVFHADCLKEWVAKRAVCPLCQRTDIVTPHLQQQLLATQNTTEETESNPSRDPRDNNNNDGSGPP